MLTILVVFLLVIAVGLFQVIFNQLETKPYKKNYYELLFKLSKDPDDIDMINKTIEAGKKYYGNIKFYKVNIIKGMPISADSPKVIDVNSIDKNFIYEDMVRITDAKTLL